MKSLSLFFGIALGIQTFATPATAPDTGAMAKELLDGVSLCDSPNNPINDGLRYLRGDYFNNVQGGYNQDGTVITADVISNPSVRNTAIGAPARIVGKIELIKGYKRVPGQPGAVLFCTLTVKAL